jgi:hypothetical protein
MDSHSASGLKPPLTVAVAARLEEVAKKLTLALAFGWRSGSPLR